MDSYPVGILLNISSGLHAPQEVKQSLLLAVEAGIRKFHCFVKESQSSVKKTRFYAPVERSGLKIFGKAIDMTISSELVIGRELTLLKPGEEVSMKNVLNIPVTSVPTSLFHEVGSMLKTIKTELLHKLEDFRSTVGFLLLQCTSGVVRHPRDIQVSVAIRFCRVLIFVSS